jgi:hypothetical protein
VAFLGDRFNDFINALEQLTDFGVRLIATAFVNRAPLKSPIVGMPARRRAVLTRQTTLRRGARPQRDIERNFLLVRLRGEQSFWPLACLLEMALQLRFLGRQRKSARRSMSAPDGCHLARARIGDLARL